MRQQLLELIGGLGGESLHDVFEITVGIVTVEFSGLYEAHDVGGERAATIYSLFGTAALNDLNPEAYLHYVLERIADCQISRVGELLPWNVAARLQSLRLAA